jgi:hypothetical protein
LSPESWQYTLQWVLSWGVISAHTLIGCYTWSRRFSTFHPLPIFVISSSIKLSFATVSSLLLHQSQFCLWIFVLALPSICDALLFSRMALFHHSSLSTDITSSEKPSLIPQNNPSPICSTTTPLLLSS